MTELVRIEKCFVVRRPLGLHARPAGRLVSIASHYECELVIGRDGEWVNARSVLSILSLAATQNTELRVRGEGLDAAEAVEALGLLIEAEDEEPPPTAV